MKNEPRQSARQMSGPQSFFRQLLISHMSVAAIGLVAVLIGIAANLYLQRQVSDLVRTVEPTARLSVSVHAGVNQSLAGLRGWANMPDQRFLDEWRQAWDVIIRPEVKALQNLDMESRQPWLHEKMAELLPLLAELEESQWWVQEVAQTPGNEPATVLLQLEIEPTAREIQDVFDSFVSLAAGYDVVLTVDQSKMLAEAARSFSKSLLLLHGIVDDGRTGMEGAFKENIQKAQTAWSALQHSLSTDALLQRDVLAYIAKQQDAVARTAAAAIAIRKSDQWNVAYRLMETETVPLARRVVNLTGDLSLHADQLLRQRGRSTARMAVLAIVAMGGLFFFMLLTVRLVAAQRARVLSRPVSALADGAGKLAAGTLSRDLAVIGGGELAELTRSFNAMRTSLAEARQTLVRQERLAIMGQLTATVAHELRNPLGTVRGTLFLIRERLAGPDATTDRIMARAERNIERCNQIIEELLDFTRTDQLHRQSVELDPWLAALLDTIHFAEGITLHRELHAPITVKIDTDKMRRALLNLVANGGEAMTGHSYFAQSGTGTAQGDLTITTTVNNGRVEIGVADTGPGIAPENMAKILEPLFSTKSFGVGLGLPMVKRYAELHNGGLEIKSEVGRGATVVLWLPCNDNENPGDDSHV